MYFKDFTECFAWSFTLNGKIKKVSKSLWRLGDEVQNIELVRPKR